MDPAIFPPLNASLNGLATVFLILAIVRIKKGDRQGHARCMTAALVVSAVFLISYVTHKVLLGHANTPFPEEYPVARRIYLAILFTHIPLAIGMLPPIFIALARALKSDFAGHRRIAKWAFPIWLYVSVTGVIVYFMLYQWFPAKEATHSSPPPSPAPLTFSQASALTFEPETYEHKAPEGETQFTATFIGKNTGTAPVRIVKVDSSCSCLLAQTDVETVAPGEKVTITAVFDISKLAGDAEKRVFVTTDEPGALERVLPVKVNVKPILTVEPNSLEWSRGGEPRSLEATLRVLREKPIRVLSAVSSREAVSVELKTIEEGREYRLILTPKSTADILLGLVRIATDCELEEHRQQLLFFVVQDQNVEKGK